MPFTASLSLQSPFPASDEQSQPAANQEPQNQKQAPDRKEKQGQNSGVLGLGLQQPFDDADGRQQADRASGQANEENDEFLRGHRHGSGNRSRVKSLDVNSACGASKLVDAQGIEPWTS